MAKIAERIANLIRDEELTTGEIDYLMSLLNTKRHRAPYRDAHLSNRADDEKPDMSDFENDCADAR